MPYPTKKLGEIVDILDNQRKPISSIEREKRIKGKEILYPYYGATQQNGVIDDYLFDEELVLLGEDGVDFYNKYKHKAYLISGKTWVNNHAHVLKGKDGILLNKFLLNYLNIFDYHGYVSGATRLKLNQSSMKNIPIPLPPLPTQKLIVQKLDSSFEKIDKSIELTKKNLKNIEELNKSVLAEVFSEGEYEMKKLGEIFDVRDGTHDSPKFFNDGFPLVTSKNLVNNLIDLSNVKYITEDDYININKRSKVNKGDLLFAMIGTIGNPTIIDFEPNFAIKNVALFKKKSEIMMIEFLKYYLLSDFVIQKMLNEANGATQKFVGLGYLRLFQIPLPPLQKQKEIVAQLDKVFEKNKALKESYEKKLKDLEEMKQSLLKEAFEGRLVKE